MAHRSDKNEFATVSVIVPAKNEAQNLEHVLPMIPAWVDEVIDKSTAG